MSLLPLQSNILSNTAPRIEPHDQNTTFTDVYANQIAKVLSPYELRKAILLDKVQLIMDNVNKLNSLLKKAGIKEKILTFTPDQNNIFTKSRITILEKNTALLENAVKKAPKDSALKIKLQMARNLSSLTTSLIQLINLGYYNMEDFFEALDQSASHFMDHIGLPKQR